jgi:hypothetical protein
LSRLDQGFFCRIPRVDGVPQNGEAGEKAKNRRAFAEEFRLISDREKRWITVPERAG